MRIFRYARKGAHFVTETHGESERAHNSSHRTGQHRHTHTHTSHTNTKRNTNTTFSCSKGVSSGREKYKSHTPLLLRHSYEGRSGSEGDGREKGRETDRREGEIIGNAKKIFVFQDKTTKIYFTPGRKNG